MLVVDLRRRKCGSDGKGGRPASLQFLVAIQLPNLSIAIEKRSQRLGVRWQEALGNPQGPKLNAESRNFLPERGPLLDDFGFKCRVRLLPRFGGTSPRRALAER